MFRNRRFTAAAPFAVAFLIPAAGHSQAAASQPAGTHRETIQVTATRVPADVLSVPASISVVGGEELEARGVTQLSEALALVAGVNVAPGGDGGPAGSVPEIWGLREFDAFLLVVDGVPWGGAFNPALTALDLTNVDRIELLRGAAPVMYGATSFVGVIHVIHRDAGDARGSVSFGLRNHGGGTAAAVVPLASGDGFRQSLTVNGERRGFDDGRAGFDRGHLLYRAANETGIGKLRLDADLSLLRQDPSSPHPRAGKVLAPSVPLDANHQPSDARIDEDRIHLAAGLDRELSGNPWSSTVALTRTTRDLVRGFLFSLDPNDDPNAAGYRQDQTQTDLYVDSHVVLRSSETLRVVAGADLLYGKGESKGDNVDYHVNLDGSGAQSTRDVEVEESPRLEDERLFAGLYVQGEWTPAPRWRVEVGLRLNRTDEDRRGEVEGGHDGEEKEASSDHRDDTRLSGIVGLSYLLWDGGAADSVWVFADWRDSFKPAVVDFGPEVEGEILEPETAVSCELGFKGDHAGGRFGWQASIFRMDFENLVTGTTIDGRPALINAGKQRFDGWEIEGRARLFGDLDLTASYAHHDARFRDFVQSFDGVPTQLRGNRLEMSASELTSVGIVYRAEEGLGGFLAVHHIGDRFLTKRNSASTGGFETADAGLSYRSGPWSVRLDGRNLGDARDPVSESELGDAQYYRLPGRSFELTGGWSF